MSEEAAAPAAPAAPAAAPAEAASPAATGGNEAPQAATGSPAATGAAPSAQEAGEGVAEAMEEQGVTDPGDLDWSRTVTVTVDGKERTVPLSELRGNYELRRSSFERFEEAKRMREGVESETKRLKEIASALQDPSLAPAILRELGHGPEQLQAVQEALRAELEMPEDKRRMRELEQRERALQEREQAYKQRLAQQQAAKEQAMFRSAFNQALEPHGMADDANAMRVMARYLDHRYPRAAGAQLSKAEVSQLAVEAASYAAEQIADQRRQQVGSLDPQTLAKLLTPEQAAALREARVEEYRQGKAAPASKPQPKRKAEPERRVIHSLADFRAAIEGE